MTKKESEKKQDQKKKETQNEYSEADLLLIEKIAFKAEKIASPQGNDRITHVKDLFAMILTSKKSRTSIPKEIKFLTKHYKNLVESFEKLTIQDDFYKNFADFLSYVCISLQDNYDRHSLKFLELGTKQMDTEKLGQEYILNLSGDIAKEFDENYESNNQ